MRALRPLAGLAVLVALAGCAPRLQEIGPEVALARLADSAMIMPDGVSLPLRTWLPWDRAARAVIIALHGFNDHSAGMAMPGHGLARRGFIVVAYDQRGFGAAPQRGIWPGTPALIADLQVAVGLVHAKYPDLPLFVLGESMGGAVTMAALAGPEGLSVSGIILAAPAIWGYQTISAIDRSLLDAAAHSLPFVTVRPTGIRRVASSNRSALRRLAADPLVIKETRIDAAYGLVELMTEAHGAGPSLGRVPTLLLFGSREGILDKGSVAQFLSSLPPEGQRAETLRLALYPGGYHLLLRDFGQGAVLDDIAAWIDEPTSPLPSGADRIKGWN